MSRRANLGLTLVEILVAAAILGLILTAALSVTLSGRRLLSFDQARTSVNQNLRSALEIIGSDIRQSGARMAGVGINALELVDGDRPTVRLTVRYGLADSLPVCRISGSIIEISLNTSSVQECADADSISANTAILNEWASIRSERQGSGLSTRIYIFNEDTGVGEWLVFSGAANGKVALLNPPTRPIGTYPPGRSRLYLIEQRVYSLSGRLLQVAIDGAAPVPVIDQVDSLTIYTTRAAGNRTNDALAPGSNSDFRSVSVAITGSSLRNGAALGRRTVQGTFFPRNAL